MKLSGVSNLFFCICVLYSLFLFCFKTKDNFVSKAGLTQDIWILLQAVLQNTCGPRASNIFLFLLSCISGGIITKLHYHCSKEVSWLGIKKHFV